MGIETDTRAIWIPSNGGIENEKLYAPVIERHNDGTVQAKMSNGQGWGGGLRQSFEIERLDYIEIVVI